MSGTCCDAWRASEATWCPGCGAHLRGGRWQWWRVHVDLIAASLVFVGALGGVALASRHAPAMPVPTTRETHENYAASTSPPAPTVTSAPSPRAVERTLRLDPNDPPACQAEDSRTVAGTHADVATLVMRTHGARVGLAWVVAPRRKRGSENSAAVELDASGALRSVLQAEAQLDAEYEEHHVGRVTAAPWRQDAWSVARDERVRSAEREFIRCGPFEGALWQADPLGGSGISTAGGIFACKTLPTDVPAVLALRSETSPVELAAPDATVVAGTVYGELQATGWTLPLRLRAVRRAQVIQRLLHNLADLEGATGLTVAGVGTLVVTRYDGRLRVGWLDENLRARGDLYEIATLGGEVGLPRVAWNGHEALVVFADRGPTPPRVRGLPRPVPPPYRLYALKVTSTGPATPVPLETRPDVIEDEFAPTPAALPDGWVVVWSDGLRHARRGQEAWRHVLLRRYESDLRPRGGPMELYPEDSASDARVVTLGNRFVVAAAAGRGSSRRVVVRAGVCP